VRATQLSVAECDINEIVRQCVAESFPKRSQVELALTLADGLPRAMADSARLKRAFSELIENSVSFMPDGGQLIIRTTSADRAEARRLASLPRARQYVLIEFVDNGPGIPPDIKPNIFRPFFTSRARGMGLGLSIVKGILEAHRGTIVEIGHAGQGAHFVALIPARDV
jgi:signal transduction histidine kinase